MKELLQIVKNLQQEETQLEEEYDKEKARMAPELLDDIYYRVFGLTDEDLEVDVDVLDEDEWKKWGKTKAQIISQTKKKFIIVLSRKFIYLLKWPKVSNTIYTHSEI